MKSKHSRSTIDIMVLRRDTRALFIPSDSVIAEWMLRNYEAGWVDQIMVVDLKDAEKTIDSIRKHGLRVEEDL